MAYLFVLLGLPQSALPTLPQDMLPVPPIRVKSCLCSGLCSCGCNDGLPCTCPEPTTRELLDHTRRIQDSWRVVPRAPVPATNGWRSVPRARSSGGG